MDMVGLATVISAILGPLSAIIIALTVGRSTAGIKRITQDTHGIALETKATMIEVDQAVNGRTPRGTSTMSDDVGVMRDDVNLIREKQERDVPTVEDVTGADVGQEALLPLVRYLTVAVNELTTRLVGIDEQMKRLDRRETP